MESLAASYEAGGPFMHFITICLLIGVALCAERFSYLIRASSVKKDELLRIINSQIMQGNIEKAIAFTNQTRNPLANIIRAGLVSVANGKSAEETQTAMDAQALRDIPTVSRRIGLVATLSNLSTLLGLLGTVTGLIGAFAAVANVAPQDKAQILSNSIAEAMNSTAYGLLVAIPLLAAYGFLNGKATEIIDDIHEASVATLNFILTNRKKI